MKKKLRIVWAGSGLSALSKGGLLLTYFEVIAARPSSPGIALARTSLLLHWFNSTVPAGRRGEGKEVCTLGLSYCMAGNKSQISLENSHTVRIFHVLSPMSTFLDIRATLQPTKGVTAGQIWATEQIFHGLPCRFQ